MPKFIGRNEVFGVEKVDGFTTPAGSEVIKVSYKDGKERLMTKRTFELTATENPKDDTYFQKARFEVLIPLIINLIMEYDIYNYEMTGLFDQVKGQILNRVDRAVNFLWTADDKLWTAGVEPTQLVSLLDAEKVISKIPKVENVKEDTK